MQDRPNLLALEVAVLQRRTKLALVHVVGILSTLKIQELWPAEVRSRSEVIDDEDVLLACVVQLMNEIAADESSPAGDDNHLLPSWFAVSFFTMFVVENPSTVGTISTLPPEATTSSCPTTVST